MRHAYLIQAHCNAGQLQKLLLSLDDPRNDIYLHLDAKWDVDVTQFRCERASLNVIPRMKVNWGGPSQIWNELALLREAVKTPHGYYHLISGMDLPIKSQDSIDAFFEAGAGKEYIEFWPMNPHNLSRMLYSPLSEYSAKWWGNLVNNLFKGVQTVLGIRRNRDVEFRRGANWFSITHDFASYVVEQEPWIRKVFSHTCSCDEVFLQTVLGRSPFAGSCACTNVRFIDWERRESTRHPHIFRISDYDALTSSESLFARKFDERVDSAIITRICETVSGN